MVRCPSVPKSYGRWLCCAWVICYFFGFQSKQLHFSPRRGKRETESSVNGSIWRCSASNVFWCLGNVAVHSPCTGFVLGIACVPTYLAVNCYTTQRRRKIPWPTIGGIQRISPKSQVPLDPLRLVKTIAVFFQLFLKAN